MYDFTEMLYVVDTSQHMHFRHLKLALKSLGFSWYNKIHHVKFGRISGMSTRKGSIVILEDILNEARDRCLVTMKKSKNTKITSDDELIKVADVLGTSGLLVNAMLSKRMTNYDFNWSIVLKQKGLTGISLNYAYARLCSLERSNQILLNHMTEDQLIESLDVNHITSQEELMSLIAVLSNFDDALLQSYQSLDSYYLSKYLFELKDVVGRVIKNYNIKHEPDVRKARTRLVLLMAAKNILSTGMRIIGLNPLEKM